MEQDLRLISVDDHVVEPPHLWQEWLPAGFREHGPRVVRGGQPTQVGPREFRDTGDGPPCDWWFYEDVRMPITRPFAAVSYADREDIKSVGMTYDEMRPGCFEPTARLRDMDLNGVAASLCFPNTIPRFCGQTFLWAKDKELALACVTAYNDWMVEEWCGPSSGRLIPLGIVPLWDPHLSAAEVRRNAERGARAITFSELPSAIGIPSIHSADHWWDPLFEACNETGTVVCVHIGSSSKMPTTSDDAPLAITSATFAANSMMALADWLFSGLFQRFPNLKVAFSEAEIGWIPYLLERCDRVWETRPSYYDRNLLPNPPSTYYYDHIYGCFISDKHGINSLDEVGRRNVMFEVDYPHADSTWPNSVETAVSQLEGLADDDRERILRTNAIELFQLSV